MFAWDDSQDVISSGTKWSREIPWDPPVSFGMTPEALG